jgi:hypothetical protein
MSATITTVVLVAAASDARAILDAEVADEDADDMAEEAAEIMTTTVI